MEIEDRIRLGYERFNRRDWEAIARGLPDHFEVIDHLDERRAVGRNALRDVTTASGDLAFADLQMTPVEIVVRTRPGDRVEALVRIATTARGGTSGVGVEAELGQIWTFEDGVPVCFEQFRTWAETQRAAGAEGP